MKTFIKMIFFLFIASTPIFSQFSWDMPKTNLKVFPDSISANDLKKQMVAFSQSLGVRCWYCHDDSEGQELGQINFASDIKPQKLIAREMIRMSMTINNEHISKIKKINESASNVACMTCHRGYAKPQHLFQVLLESYNEGGISASLEKYNELKERYFGGFTFDFRENSLNTFGYQLMTQNFLEDALKVFQLNAELFPEAFNVYDSLGEIYLKMGNTQLAELNYKKSLQLNPENKNAKTTIEKMKK